MSVFIIAEVGSVHDGSVGNALSLIDAAAEAGVDAVKFQTHLSEAETLRDAPMPPYFKGEPRFEYFNRTGFSLRQWQEIKSRCDANGVEFLSSPFSEEAVSLLESLEMARYKIPSGEVTNLPMLEKIAKLNKPVLLSSGMSCWDELDRAVETIRAEHDELTVLQCTSEYPCPYDQVGLNVMLDMKARYGLPVGLSDHTLTNFATFAAVTLSASVIERHFTFSRKMYGSDARHSLEPADLADLVAGVRAIETMLESKVDKAAADSFRMMKEIFEKSIVSLVEIPAGTVLTREMLGIKKPGTGLPAARLREIVGQPAARNIEKDQLLEESDIQWS